MGIRLKKKRASKKKKKAGGKKPRLKKRKTEKEMRDHISEGRPDPKDDWADITDLFKPPTKQKDVAFQVVTRAHPALGHQVWSVDILRYGPARGGVPVRRRKGVGHFQFYLNIDVIDTPEGLGTLIDWLKNNKQKLLQHTQKSVAYKDRGGK